MQDKSIAVIAEISFKPESVQAGLQLLMSIIEPSRKELGCLQYQLFQAPDEPTRFIFIEQWQNYTIWQQHLETAHLIQLKTAIGIYLAAPIKVNWFSLVY